MAYTTHVKEEDFDPVELVAQKYVTLTSSGLKNEGEERLFFDSVGKAWDAYNAALEAYLKIGYCGNNTGEMVIRWRSRPKMESINGKLTEDKGKYSVYSRLYVYREEGESNE